MGALLKAELVKLRTTRTFVALTASAILLSLLITTLVSLLEEPTQDEVVDSVFTSDLSSIFILILAIIGITGEWRHRTITSSLLAAPDRLKFLAAKTIAFAVAGLVLSVLIAIAVTIVGYVLLSLRDLPTPDAGELLERYGRNALIAALLGAFGVGIGALVRVQVAAVVGVIITVLAIEPVLLGLVPEVGKFGPTNALPTAAQAVDPDAVGLPEDTDLVASGAAFALMLAWSAVAFAAGYTTLVKRDLE